MLLEGRTYQHLTDAVGPGEKSAHVVSFLQSEEVITIAPRLFLNLQDGWHHTVIDLPEGRWRQEFEDQVFGSGLYQMGDVLHTFPVGLLSKLE